MEKLFEIQMVHIEQFESKPFYYHAIFAQFNLNNQLVGIVGPRGVGKTTLLLRFVRPSG
jgi:predicted AAA+ superfamily ATPase